MIHAHDWIAFLAGAEVKKRLEQARLDTAAGA